MSPPDRLRARLANGKTALGTWAVMPSATAAEVMAAAGFDFVIIDMEHGPHGLEGAEHMMRACALHGCAPLVRVPGVDESAILRALDTGAAGIVVPQVQSSAQVAQILDFALYPPAGNRGHSPFTRAGGFTHEGAADRMKAANAKTFVGILVEGREGLDALPSILADHGTRLGLVYVGVYDLAKAVGHPGDIEAKAVQKAIAEAAALALQYGVTLGVLATTAEHMKRYEKLGVRFIAWQNDTGLLFQACRAVVHLRGEVD